MYIVLTYDINVKRVSKAMKICRKYLVHVQKSVFEGVITDGKLKKLKRELQNLIDCSVDKISIYELESTRYMHKEEIGVVEQQSNIVC